MIGGTASGSTSEMSVKLAQTAADQQHAKQAETEPQKEHIQIIGFRLSQLSNLFHAVGEDYEDTDARCRQGRPPDQLEIALAVIHRDLIGNFA
jgi:hypothetical protein